MQKQLRMDALKLSTTILLLVSAEGKKSNLQDHGLNLGP
jgi:hypothetical protein